MTNSFDQPLLDALGNLVKDRTGLKFDPTRLADLERGVRAASREFGFAHVQDCATWLLSGCLTDEQVRVLASHLTIGETYFFREKGSFQLIEERIFPELIEARRGLDRRLRIWSAGCCTGEEAYSLAIILSQMLPDLDDWQATVLATDINEHFLHKAREAVFGNWSFREAWPHSVESCFTHATLGRRRLLPHIRNLVTCAPLNLIDDIYPSAANGTNAMDLILCRNVLIYLDEQQGQKVVRKLSQCLAEGGWLLVGAAEGSLIRQNDLKSAEIAGVMAFRKLSGDSPQVVTPWHMWEPPIESPPAIVRESASRSEPLAGPVALDQIADIRAEQIAISKALEAYEQHRYGEVVDFLIPLCRGDQVSPKALELLSRTYANQGNPTAALASCEQALNHGKTDARIHYLKASILQELGQIDQAVASLRRAIYLDPDFLMAHIGASHLAQKRGRRAESQRHIEIARRLLASHDASQPVPEAEGIDAAHLARLIATDVMIREPS